MTDDRNVTEHEAPADEDPSAVGGLSRVQGSLAAGGLPGAAGPQRPPRHPAARRAFEWLGVIVAAAAIALLVRAFAVETFSIPSLSMTPSLLTGDRILVDKLPWVRDDIHRGDIVVFRRVAADPQTQYADLVKRVVGLPGETIWSKGDTLYVDGRVVKESWLPPLGAGVAKADACPEQNYDIARTKIPPGHYFVMGDCRAQSYDSRYWGTVPASNIVGKVFLVIWRNGHPWFHWF